VAAGADAFLARGDARETEGQVKSRDVLFGDYKADGQLAHPLGAVDGQIYDHTSATARDAYISALGYGNELTDWLSAQPRETQEESYASSFHINEEVFKDRLPRRPNPVACVYRTRKGITADDDEAHSEEEMADCARRCSVIPRALPSLVSSAASRNSVELP